MGVAASGVEYIDEPALLLMIAPLPRQSFRLFSGLQPLPAASSGFTAHAAQVHAEGSTPDLQELIHELSARTATGYLFGGLSSARNRTVHIADGVFTGGISGVAFGPEVDLISRVTQGCQPIGPWRNITEGERNFVVSLDGKPALDCLFQDLGLDRTLSDQALSQTLAGTLVGFWTPEYAKTVNITGYHLHFLSQDHQHGGHLLQCRGRQLRLQSQREGVSVSPDPRLRTFSKPISVRIRPPPWRELRLTTMGLLRNRCCWRIRPQAQAERSVTGAFSHVGFPRPNPRSAGD